MVPILAHKMWPGDAGPCQLVESAASSKPLIPEHLIDVTPSSASRRRLVSWEAWVIPLISLILGVALSRQLPLLIRPRLLYRAGPHDLNGLGCRAVFGCESRLKAALLEAAFLLLLILLVGQLDRHHAAFLSLLPPRALGGSGVPYHGFHVLEALLMLVVVAAKVGFVLIHARVALGTELAVEGLPGQLGGGRLRFGEGEMTLFGENWSA